MILRLPLQVPTEPRDSINTDKDSLLQNCFVESDPVANYAVKRPGMILQEDSILDGNSKGIFFNDSQGKLFYVNLSEGITEIVL
jgi:hypothetical protein